MRLLRDLQRKKKAQQRKELAKKVGLGTLVGGVLGSAAGILLAPDSGKNTRKKIKDNAVDMKENVEKNIEKTKSTIEKTVQDKKEEIRNTVEKIKKIGRTSKDEAAASADEEASENE